jgi:hypothetical protein
MAYRDYEEFIAALNAHGVRYLVVGAHAVAFHARPRATKDLDVLVDPTAANARKVLAALRDFFGGAELGNNGFGGAGVPARESFGAQPTRIGSFSSAWRRSELT